MLLSNKRLWSYNEHRGFDMVKKYQVFLVIILVMAAGFLFLFIRFGLNDSRSITDFSAAYQRYDSAISDEANSVLASPATSSIKEQKADGALTDLKIKASVRISSLTKNDGEIMKVMAEIADLSTKELDALKAYREAAADQSGDMATFANQFRDLTGQRQSAYARFLELAGG